MRSRTGRSRVAITAVVAVLFSGLGLPVVEAAEKPPRVWVPPNTPLPQTKPVKGVDAKPCGQCESQWPEMDPGFEHSLSRRS